MESLAAFSLVAGILQVLDISFKAVKDCREIYKDGSVASNRDTEMMAEALARATTSLHASQRHSSTPPSPGYTEILNLSHNCARIATELHVEIKKLKLHRRSRHQALSKAVNSIRKTRMLKEKRLKLEEYERTLDTVILIRLDTQSLRRSHQFNSLNDSVRDLAVKLEQGSRSTAQLLSNQTSQILDHFDRKFDDREGARRIDQARERFLASLFFPDIEAREDEIEEAFEGTCKWIFDPPADEESNTKKWHNFREWLQTGKDIYWINGKPGAGKSTLMKYIADEPRTARYLSEWQPNTDLITATFFFKNLGSELQKSATGLLRSLIWQLIRHWPDMIYQVLERFDDATGQALDSPPLTLLPTWTNKRLLPILKDFAIEKPANITLCVFIDGLDEYIGDQDTLLNIIRILSSADGCKICVSSRPDQTYHLEFQGYPQCRVQDLNRRDIEKMVYEKLKPCLEDARPIEIESIKYLIEDLIDKAEGVFMWLSIMIKDLIKGLKCGDSIKELRQRLGITPSSINGLYRRILEGLDKPYLDFALKTYQKIVAAKRLNDLSAIPLTLLDFACMDEEAWVRVEEFDGPYFCSSVFRSKRRELYTQLNARCGNLIDIKNNKTETDETISVHHGPVVSFIHRTVVEFLKDEYVSKFSDNSCLTTSWIPLARARIGLLFLLPWTQLLIDVSDMDDEDPTNKVLGLYGELAYDLEKLVEHALLTISFGENTVRKADPIRPLVNVQSQLTSQVLQTIQYLTTKDDMFYETPDQMQSGSMKLLVKQVLSGLIDTDVSCARNSLDCMKLAAFFGCESYIRTHLSTETPDEQLRNILLSVIKGVQPLANRLESYPISFLNIVDLLLQKRRALQSKLNSEGPLIENAKWIKPEESADVLIHCRSSLWGAFLLQICRKAERLFREQDDSELYGEIKVWIQRCVQVVEGFLNEGFLFKQATHNARIGLATIFFHLNSNFSFYADTTPLGCLRTYIHSENDCLSPVKSVLEANGAVERLRYRFCRYKGTYYRIKASQSKSLERLLIVRRYLEDFDNYFWFGAFRFEKGIEPLHIVREIISANDTLDEDTMEEEWARGGTSWPEEDT